MEIRFGRRVKLRTIETDLQRLEKIGDEKIVQEGIKFDFSATRWFSAGSLIFLIPLLGFLKKKRAPIKISLPIAKPGENPEGAQKARDFLKRWKFFNALRAYFGTDEDFLEPDQLDYLVEEQKNYLRTKYLDERGNLSELYSTKTIEISHFTEKVEDNNVVSRRRIERYLSDYAEERILNMLANGIKWRNKNSNRRMAYDFVKNCVREPLINALDHSKATIGLITAQIDSKYFNISIVDNGLGIPRTTEQVYEYFKKTQTRTKKGISDAELIEYAFDLPKEKEIEAILDEIDAKRDAGLIEFAHLRGITSKPETHKGMGLFLLKDFVGKTGGFFDVRSCRGYVRFKFDANRGMTTTSREKWTFQPGTFISIYLPHKIEGWKE